MESVCLLYVNILYSVHTEIQKKKVSIKAQNLNLTKILIPSDFSLPFCVKFDET